MLNPSNEEREILRLAEAAIPSRTGGEPLFPLAWHARIFALIVTLVRDGKMSWIAFQQRLVVRLKDQQAAATSEPTEEIDLRYFDCWLQAAEDAMTAEGFVGPNELVEQVAHIRRSVAEVRTEQFKASGA
jgi:nitrile hydratase accessory protein